MKEKTSASNGYFDMVEYFCNGHNDTAVDVISYDCSGKEIERETFSWTTGCGEVTSEGIWRKAEEFAQQLMQNGMVPRHKFPFEMICSNNVNTPKKEEKKEERNEEHYIFRKTGKLIYSEPTNPYETVEVYLDLEPNGWAVKSYVSEHGPDGGSSWRGIFIDEENRQKFELAVGKSFEAFLKKYLRQHSNTGLIGFAKLLDAYEIAYTQKYAF